MALTAMTYNIKTGGGSRLGEILDVIGAHRPDILALQELRHWERDGGRLLRHAADTLGMRGHLARSLLGQPVAVLVRPPLEIIDRRTVRLPLHHAAAIVDVLTPAGPLTVTGTHLNPFSSSRRRAEAAALARRFSGGLALLMGDLNALDPDTDHASRLAALPGVYRSRHVRRRGPEVADTRAIATLHAAGYRDLWVAAGATGQEFTAPSTEGGGREFGTGGMRIDYILGSAAVAAVVRSCTVVTGGAAERASDHYPVVATLDL